ncbi:DnaJ domain-containing protein, partial [Sporodiniella umbellata]
MFTRRLLHSTGFLRQSHKDYYQILQISPQADKKLIKHHYYRLSKKYHPDLNPNNDEARQKFLEINEAYAILGNEANRRQYDHGSIVHSPMTEERSQSHYAHAWHFKRRTSRNTGSASARAQAEQRTQEGHFNHREHYTRHYEAEEQRRRTRMAQAAERQGVRYTEIPRHKKENTWARFWKLGIVLAGISYATDYVVYY